MVRLNDMVEDQEHSKTWSVPQWFFLFSPQFVPVKNRRTTFSWLWWLTHVINTWWIRFLEIIVCGVCSCSWICFSRISACGAVHAAHRTSEDVARVFVFAFQLIVQVCRCPKKSCWSITSSLRCGIDTRSLQCIFFPKETLKKNLSNCEDGDGWWWLAYFIVVHHGQNWLNPSGSTSRMRDSFEMIIWYSMRLLVSMSQVFKEGTLQHTQTLSEVRWVEHMSTGISTSAHPATFRDGAGVIFHLCAWFFGTRKASHPGIHASFDALKGIVSVCPRNVNKRVQLCFHWPNAQLFWK